MKLSELSSILYSDTGSIQMAYLWSSATCEDIDKGSVDYLVANYSDKEVYHIVADGDYLVICVR